MKVLVAAEDTGSVQVVSFGLSRKNAGKEAFHTFGEESRVTYIQKMTRLTKPDGKSYISIARKGGALQLYSDGFRLVKEWKPMKGGHKAVVGLAYSDNRLCTCSASGLVAVRDLGTPHSDFTYSLATIEPPISSFRMHPNQPGVVATGGKDKDLEIFQIFSTEPQDVSQPLWEMHHRTRRMRPMGGHASLATSPSARSAERNLHNHHHQFMRVGNPASSPWSSNEENSTDFEDDSLLARMQSRITTLRDYTLDPMERNEIDDQLSSFSFLQEREQIVKMFRAKNVHRDELGNGVPIWISDIQFLDIHRPVTEGFRLATSTRFGEIRIYDTKRSKRPIFNIQASGHPIVSLFVDRAHEELIFADTQRTIGRLNYNTGVIVKRFTVTPGACQQVDLEPNSGTLACGGIDGYLRVYDLSNGKLKAKINIHSRISGVMVLDGSPDQEPSAAHRRTREEFANSDDDYEVKRRRYNYEL
ncbi:hypothetical protein TRVA0_014S00430 [Trichomonascus vanleenenianus]|uniref:uncharacterized protein n=1 Tax=Trichomonascus vanleenenianus TaxID=2268995 RepID=UPI003EC994A6